MEHARKLDSALQTIAWGMIFVWLGIRCLLGFLPEGTGLIGVGLIFLGLNVARRLNGIPTNGFSITLGILGLVWGGLEVAPSVLYLPLELPIFPILLIVLGGILLTGELLRAQKTGFADSR